MGPYNGDFGGGLMDGQQVCNVIHIFASEGFLRKRILTQISGKHVNTLYADHTSTNVQIVGITSWEARGCGHPEHPGVFLQVKEKLSNILCHLLRKIKKC